MKENGQGAFSEDSPQQPILSIELERLHAHPANPNRLSEARFRKLASQIERTGQYEPVVVRRHPYKAGAYQILNGHHRVRAMKQLGRARADCVVFCADDEQALVYLATLNRMNGRDNAVRKSRLMHALCRQSSSRELAKRLPESRRAIEKRAAHAKRPLPAEAKAAGPMLVPLTFFVDESDHAMLCEAFEKAAGDCQGTLTQRRVQALRRMARGFLEK
jgi:ParB/RepB/Spo0J family partition protein